MAAVALDLMALLLFHETYIPTILQNKVQRVKKEYPSQAWYTVLDLRPRDTSKGKASTIIESAIRPRKLLHPTCKDLTTDCASHICDPRSRSFPTIAVLRLHIRGSVPCDHYSTSRTQVK